jgi:hypothetical protein
VWSEALQEIVVPRTTVPINTIRQILLYAPYDGPGSQFRCPIATLEFLALLIGLVEVSHLRRPLGAYGAGPSSGLLHCGQLVAVY